MQIIETELRINAGYFETQQIAVFRVSLEQNRLSPASGTAKSGYNNQALGSHFFKQAGHAAAGQSKMLQ
ncbi:hypothetical protein D3C80_1682380 [compost metagenome]